MAEPVELYGVDLASDQIVTERFRYLVRYWRNRNKFIKDVRNAIEGLNKIESPVSAQYKVRVMHLFVLASLHNEKMSRYLLRPTIQAIQDEDYEDDARARSSRQEKGINVAWYEMERRGDADAWSRAIGDSLLLDMGVLQTVRAATPHWTELVTADKAALDSGKPNLIYPMQSKERMDYKKEHGVPIKKRYIPLEYWYPSYDGETLLEAYDVEERSLVSVLNNPLFRNSNEGSKVITEIRGRGLGPDGGLSTMVNIVQMVNNSKHAYYMLDRPYSEPNGAWPKVNPITTSFRGDLKLLYCYDHGIPRNLYNPIAGRFGGWKTSTNRIEGVGKALLELCSALDEIASQVLTNVRATYWPMLNFILDPEQRGYGTAGSKPEAPALKEGQPIVTFVGEDIKPIFRPDDNPMAMWLFDQINTQVGKLGGNPVLFGGRQEGVDTGYAQAVQQTAAESIDNKQKQHIQFGAEIEALLIGLHVKAIGEELYVHYVEKDDMGGKKGKYVILDPKDFTPMPRFDARVESQRPMDYIAALRAFREATDDRDGKGPALSDDTARSDILALEAPDVEYNKILIEAMKREMVTNGTMAAKIGERLNIKLATTGVPSVSPEMLQQVDPTLVAAMQEAQPAMAEGGGTSPGLLAGIAETAGIGLPPGPAPGNPEPFNRVGEAAAMNEMTGGNPI